MHERVGVAGNHGDGGSLDRARCGEASSGERTSEPWTDAIDAEVTQRRRDATLHASLHAALNDALHDAVHDAVHAAGGGRC